MQTEQDRGNGSLKVLGLLALALLGAGLLTRKGRYFFPAAAGLLFIGLFLKPAADRIAALWLKFSAVLGAINSALILTLIFYLVLTPVAFLYRLTHGDFLGLRRKPGESGAWQARDHEYGPADLEDTW